MAQLNNELAEKEMIKKLRFVGTWIARIKTKNNWVGNDVIKIPRRGASPIVLINNEIYPIVSDKREDDYVIVGLNKYETTNTIVSDDELETLGYEKLSDVQLDHREELEEKIGNHALHTVAPPAHSADTPVLATTGADDGTGRLRLTTKDIINYKKELDKKKVPVKGRLLILCPDHVADLLLEDTTFQTSYQNIKEGLISPSYLGFETYEDVVPVYYKDVAGTLTREAFDAEPEGQAASIVIHLDNCAKATGTVKRYAVAAADNPEMRENTIGFRLYAIVIAYKSIGQGAIVSGTD